MSQLITIILSILAMILVLGPLVALHEWGHYIVARMCGVKVLTYSVGFGKKIWCWTSPKTGTVYQVAALPLGGYVKMLDGRESDIPVGDEHLAFDKQHPLKKMAIVVAGPLMNFIIAIVLFTILFMTPSEQYNTRIGSVLVNSGAEKAEVQAGDTIVAIDNQEVNSWESISYILADRMGENGDIQITVTPYENESTEIDHKKYTLKINQFMQAEDKGKSPLETLGILPWNRGQEIKPIIHELVPNGAGIRQGLQVGDEIVRINDVKVDNWLTTAMLIKDNPEKSLDMVVKRDGSMVELDIMPRGVTENRSFVGKIGAGVNPDIVKNIKVPDSYITTIQYKPVPALEQAINKTYKLSYMTLKSMGKMLTGMIGLENISGPITIAKVAKQSFDISWQMVLSTAGLISLSLAVLNLLPIPVLDGGHLLFYLVELIRGKPLSEEVQIIGFNIGLLVMGCFMLLAIGMDISSFF